MATQCFLIQDLSNPASTAFSLGTNSAKLSGTTSGWQGSSVAPGQHVLALARGSGIVNVTVPTVSGNTSGLEMQDAGSIPYHWISPPLDRDITISGTITFNLWMGEATTSVNAGAMCVIERINSEGAIVSTIASSAKGTELPKTSSIAAQNWTVTATSTNMLKGDRIRIRVVAKNVGTMGTDATGVQFNYSGTTGAASGDSYVTFTETFLFLTTDPTTQTLFPTATASDVSVGTDEREMWTARGSTATSATRASATGWTAPLQLQIGGVDVEWYTRRLQAFTLTAPVYVRPYQKFVAVTDCNVSYRAELAVCDADGTNAIVWAATTCYELTYLTDSVSPVTYLAGDDLAVTDGQRLRFRLYIDDAPSAAMTSGQTPGFTFSGPSSLLNGDTKLIFGQTLVELVSADIPILVMPQPYRGG